MYRKIYLITLFAITLIALSCKKEWLEEKTDQALTVPATIKDLQNLLDNTNLLNRDNPILGEIGAGDFYLTTSSYLGRPVDDRNKYIWAPGDVYQGGSPFDWSTSYQKVYYANVVLEGVKKVAVTEHNKTDIDNITGSAAFYRAFSFYNLAQVFCRPYVPSGPNADPGIVLRTDADINTPSKRSTVEETYRQILSDLNTAKQLLTTAPLYKTRPSRQATFGLLARVYLSMENYDSAAVYANACLSIYNTLVDFKTVNVTPRNPFSYTNQNEIIFHSRLGSNNMFPQETRLGYVETELFNLYASNDRRKTVYYKTINGRLAFVGSYYGANFLFDGIATDEMYLIKAECLARAGNRDAAMDALNALLVKRFDNSFVPLKATTADEALSLILIERRKELCFRGIRWTDLRRLNRDTRFQRTVFRTVNSQTYTLPPNDNRYVWPIPDNEILFSGIAQNPR